MLKRIRLTVLAFGLLGLIGLLGLVGPACRPLIVLNPETGNRGVDQSRPLCERVVQRMINCSTDRAFRERLRENREKAVASCKKHGRADAERCDREQTCDAFVRCLAR